MDPIQQEINIHKSKLLNLINNLNNTQSIDDEISINNDIKTESECLKSLLNIKQSNLMNQINQINQNNNFNANPFMIQPNLFINQPIMNMNPVVQNNFNLLSINDSKNNKPINKINVRFRNQSRTINIICQINKTVYDLIDEYRRKSNDVNENLFLFHDMVIDPLSSSTIEEIGLKDLNTIIVCKKNDLKG